MHSRAHFDAIISFDLIATGGLAWRIAKDLSIPASGWATGDDIRVTPCSPHGRVVIQALKRLDLVFYQSRELHGRAPDFLGIQLSQMSPNRHVVLSRGIPAPPALPKLEVRKQIRAKWRITEDVLAVLYIGRIVRDKGMFELLDAISLAIARQKHLICVLVGSTPGFDESSSVRSRIERDPALREHVTILPACPPDKVWEYLCAADIFVFPSHQEGMPNSLLEALAMGLPAVAFAIPPVLEIEAGRNGLFLVPPFNSNLYSEAILQLAASSDRRVQMGERGRSEIMNRFMVKKNMALAVQHLTHVVEKQKLGRACKKEGSFEFTESCCPSSDGQK
jgi:glycosyltransferase involved in cell wall biosynthesis